MAIEYEQSIVELATHGFEHVPGKDYLIQYKIANTGIQKWIKIPGTISCVMNIFADGAAKFELHTAPVVLDSIQYTAENIVDFEKIDNTHEFYEDFIINESKYEAGGFFTGNVAFKVENMTAFRLNIIDNNLKPINVVYTLDSFRIE